MASSFTAAIRGLDDWIAGPASLLDELVRVKSGSRIIATVSDDGSVIEIQPSSGRKPSAPLSLPVSPDEEPPTALRSVANGKTIHLGIPASWVIARRIELPLEADSHLDGIVASRMGALSPLTISDIYFGHKVVEIDREARQLIVAVAIVPRARVAAALACLAVTDARQILISAPFPECDEVIVSTYRQQGSGTRGRIKFVLAGILGISLVAAITALAAQPLIKKSYAERRAAVEVRAERARQAIALAEVPEAETAPEQSALNIKEDAVSALAALDDLAEALPLHSYATEVSFANGRMRLSGRTTDVPEVLTALESSGRFEDSKLVGPALRGEDGVTSEFDVDTQPLIRTGGDAAMMPLWRDKRFQSLIVIALLIVGALIVVADTVMTWRAEARTLAFYEERTALLESQASNSAVHEAETPTLAVGGSKILLGSQTSGLVSAEFQRLLSEYVERVGAMIRRVDVPTDGQTGLADDTQPEALERIRLTADIEVMEQSLPDLLYAIEAGSPVMIIDSFRLRLNRAVDLSGGNQNFGSLDRPLSLNVSLSAFREKDPLP